MSTLAVKIATHLRTYRHRNNQSTDRYAADDLDETEPATTPISGSCPDESPEKPPETSQVINHWREIPAPNTPIELDPDHPVDAVLLHLRDAIRAEIAKRRPVRVENIAEKILACSRAVEAIRLIGGDAGVLDALWGDLERIEEAQKEAA